MKDKLCYWLGLYGEIVGLGLVILVSVWDLLWMGARHILHYAINIKGVVLIWLAIGLIFVGKRSEKNFR